MRGRGWPPPVDSLPSSELPCARRSISVVDRNLLWRGGSSGSATGAIPPAPIASGGPVPQIKVRRSRPVLLVSIHRRHALVRRHRLGRAHNLLPPVLTRKTGSSDGVLPLHWSGGPAHARCRASSGRGVCRLRFRATAGGHKGRVPRQGCGQWHLSMPARARRWLHSHSATISMSRPSPMPMGGRRSRQRLLPADLLLGLTRKERSPRIVPSCSLCLL
jgi:hypothetical protein